MYPLGNGACSRGDGWSADRFEATPLSYAAGQLARRRRDVSAYLVAVIEVHDPESYKRYAERAPETITKYGGRYLIRGAQPDVQEGEWPLDRLVVLEFPDAEAARRFYHSPEYQEIVPLRQAASKGAVAILPGYTP